MGKKMKKIDKLKMVFNFTDNVPCYSDVSREVRDLIYKIETHYDGDGLKAAEKHNKDHPPTEKEKQEAKKDIESSIYFQNIIKKNWMP